MVAIIGHSKDIRSVLTYNERKVKAGKAEVIYWNKFACSANDLGFDAKLSRFKKLQERSPRVKTNTLHISLNFAVDEKITDAVMCGIADEYMQAIGFDQQPYLVYRHSDAAHPHMHLVTTLINSEGKRINTHNIGKLKSEPARKLIEQKYGLVIAGDQRSQLRKEDMKECSAITYGVHSTRQTISDIARNVIRTYRFTSIAELNAVLSNFNVRAQVGKDDSYLAKVQGLQFQALDNEKKPIGTRIKASSLSGRPTLRKLEQQFKVNEVLRKKHKQRLTYILTKVVAEKTTLEPSQLKATLKKWNVDILYRMNEAGRLYGVTLIDHSTRCVFNGSDLGKQFSANALAGKFIASPSLQTPDRPRTVVPQLTGSQTKSGNVLEGLMTPTDNNEPLPCELDILKGNRKRKRKLKR